MGKPESPSDLSTRSLKIKVPFKSIIKSEPKPKKFKIIILWKQNIIVYGMARLKIQNPVSLVSRLKVLGEASSTSAGS